MSTKEKTEQSKTPMQHFIAKCPEGQVIGNRRSEQMPPYKVVIVGYAFDSRELGIFHWTSSESESRLKSVVANILRLSEEAGVRVADEDIHILNAEPVEEIPEGVELGIKNRHFIPLPGRRSPEELLFAAQEALNETDDEAERERLDSKIAKLEARIAKAAGTLEELTEVTFKTKKAAEAAARENGLTVDNVLKNEQGKWTVVAR